MTKSPKAATSGLPLAGPSVRSAGFGKRLEGWCDSTMRESENMQRELEGRFSPLSNRRKSGKNDPSPSYWYSFQDSTDAVCSLDMVRLKLRFRGDRSGIEFDERAAKLPIISEYQSWVARVKPGGWRCLHTFGFGDSSATVGVGLMSKNCSIDMSVGFLEFNPNKVGDSEGFRQLLVYLRRYVASGELVRYDLAVDVPVSRPKLRLAKDGRKYKCEISSSLTEYLGRRNAGGYVKVYDKAAESKLDTDLTRIELTCDAGWSVENIRAKWPTVYGLRKDVGAGLTKSAALAVRLMATVIELGSVIEPELMDFDPKTRKKYRDALMGAKVDFPLSGAAAVLMQAVEWAKLFDGDSNVVAETSVEYPSVQVGESVPAQVAAAGLPVPGLPVAENSTGNEVVTDWDIGTADVDDGFDEWLSETAESQHEYMDWFDEVTRPRIEPFWILDELSESEDARVDEGYRPVPSAGCVGRGFQDDEGFDTVRSLE